MCWAGHATRHFLINTSIYDALRRVYGGQLRREPDNYHGYSDHRPDLALLVEGTLKVFDLKVFDPISSVPGQTGLRGAYVGFGNTAEAAADAVVGRRRRGVPADGRFDRRTGRGPRHTQSQSRIETVAQSRAQREGLGLQSAARGCDCVGTAI